VWEEDFGFCLPGDEGRLDRLELARGGVRLLMLEGGWGGSWGA
jgi:hypothetical protein